MWNADITAYRVCEYGEFRYERKSFDKNQVGKVIRRTKEYFFFRID